MPFIPAPSSINNLHLTVSLRSLLKSARTYNHQLKLQQLPKNMGSTLFRTLIITLRILAGCCAGAGLGLYINIFINLVKGIFVAQYPGLTALPLAAVSCTLTA
jgi:hypothetical protein